MALTEQAIEKLRGTLNSLGWTDVMKPVISQFGKGAIDALVTSPSARTGEHAGADDNELRGSFKAYRRVLEFFEQEVKIHEANRILEEAQKKDLEAVGAGSPYPPDQNSN